MNADQARNILTSCDPKDAANALESLGASGKLTDLQSMLAFAKNPDLKVARTAVLSCSNLIRNNLITHFHELDPHVRQKLGTIMESLVPQIIDEIGKDLWCNEDGRRLRALQILGLLKKNPTIRDILAKLVQDKDVKIRATAVNLLGKIIGPNDHELIMSLLSDKDKRVRANSVEALENLGNKRFVPILLRFRKDPVNRIRGNVLKALYNLGYVDILDDLVAMLESPDHFMKASALWVASQIKLRHVKIEDLAGLSFLSDNEMVFLNAKKVLVAFNTPRTLGYMRYLESESIEIKAVGGQNKPLSVK
jgi:HEAT repeat protein